VRSQFETIALIVCNKPRRDPPRTLNMHPRSRLVHCFLDFLIRCIACFVECTLERCGDGFSRFVADLAEDGCDIFDAVNLAERLHGA